MQLRPVRFFAIAPHMTWKVDCLSREEDDSFLVTISIFIKGQWCGRRNNWNKSDLRKNCFEQRLNFDEVWLTVSTHSEVNF
jgi:hypothetical protein